MSYVTFMHFFSATKVSAEFFFWFLTLQFSNTYDKTNDSKEKSKVNKISSFFSKFIL